MKICSYPISGDDFARAGAASRSLKEELKKVGMDPWTIRRAVIAAYEAEMNAVIHAFGGRMFVKFDDRQIDIEVGDAGPGISDIDRAMEEGFSTAPESARALGFGAGMGLPNIKKNSDRLRIESTAGRGTQVRFTVLARPQQFGGAVRNSVRVIEGACRGCGDCVRACPMSALRVRREKPEILEHLCIDCAACIGVCKSGALAMEGATGSPQPSGDVQLILPPAFLAQFGPGPNSAAVLAALGDLGFRNPITTQGWEQVLREAVVQYAREQKRDGPILSPACPVIVNLVETRFPSLIESVAPYLSPMESALEHVKGCRAAFVASCPAQCTALTSEDVAGRLDILAPASLREKVMPLLAARRENRREAVDPAARWIESAGESLPAGAGIEVSGIRHAMNVLEAVENGRLQEASVLELFACDLGCFGSPLMEEDASIARRRWLARRGGLEGRPPSDSQARAIRRTKPFCARPGMRLDRDMSKAVLKLRQIDELTRSLPGKDCAQCGAPTCAGLAEDIVQGRAIRQACPHRVRAEEEAL